MRTERYFTLRLRAIWLMFESAYIASEPYGVKMRLCEDPVTITDSKMKFENFHRSNRRQI